MEKKRILITGMAGFIGYSLAKRLAKEELYEIIGLDNINNYYDVQLKYDRLTQLGFNQQEIEKAKLVESSRSIKFIQLDLENFQGLQDLFKEQNFHLVIHLAA